MEQPLLIGAGGMICAGAPILESNHKYSFIRCHIRGWLVLNHNP